MKEVKIIHTNDIHSEYVEFCKLSSIIKENSDDSVVLLDAGDFNDFSSSLTKASEGLLGLKLLHTLKYDALAIGNNEGFHSYKDQIKISQTNLVNILSCNIFSKNNDKLIYRPSIIINRRGIKLLIIGVSPFQPSYNIYYKLYGVYAKEPYSIIQSEIEKNKGQFDYVVLLSHLGLKADIMLTQIITYPMIIVGGHSHHYTDLLKVNNSYIHHSGVRGSHIGIISLYMNETNDLVDVQAQNIKNDNSMQFNDEIYNMFLEEKKILEKQLDNVFCTIDETLHSAIDAECNFTNLIADYLYQNYKSDFALINSGITSKTLEKGEITYNDLYNVCKSPLRVAVMKIKGKYILAALRDSLNKNVCFDTRRRPGYREKYLGMLHVSSNCKIVYNGKEANLFVNGLQINDENYYYVVTNDYLSRGMGYNKLGRNISYDLISDKDLLDVIRDSILKKNMFNNINQKRWAKE